MAKKGNYYQILNIPYDASYEAVRSAYLQRRREIESSFIKRASDEEDITALIDAFDTLKDPELRVEYNLKTLGHAGPPPRVSDPQKNSKSLEGRLVIAVGPQAVGFLVPLILMGLLAPLWLSGTKWIHSIVPVVSEDAAFGIVSCGIVLALVFLIVMARRISGDKW